MDLIWANPQNDFFRYYQRKYEHDFGNIHPTILFSLQPGLDYPDWVLDYINSDDHTYTWLIRLHPYVDEHELLFLKKLRKKSNIYWAGVEVFPLDILLQNVALHITRSSSVVIEAEEYRCVSIVTYPIACQMFSSQIHRGIVCYAGSGEALSAAVNNVMSKRGKGNGGRDRKKDLYVRGQRGVETLIKIIEGNQPISVLRKEIDRMKV